MPEIDSKLVKQLRDRTNAGMMDCKKALEEAGGDLEQAVMVLRKKGIAGAAKKASRSAKEGLIASYIHMDKVGVMIEVNCETDFVAKNEAFRDFVKDVLLHIAAAQPLYVSREEVPQAAVDAEKEVAASQIKGKKPGNIVDQIVSGKVDKFYSTVCLLDQPFIKDGDQTIGDLVKAKIAEIGENIVIRRFARFAVGEGIEEPAE